MRRSIPGTTKRAPPGVPGLEGSGTFQVPRIEIRFEIDWFAEIKVGSRMLPSRRGDFCARGEAKGKVFVGAIASPRIARVSDRD